MIIILNNNKKKTKKKKNKKIKKNNKKHQKEPEPHLRDAAHAANGGYQSEYRLQIHQRLCHVKQRATVSVLCGMKKKKEEEDNGWASVGRKKKSLYLTKKWLLKWKKIESRIFTRKISRYAPSSSSDSTSSSKGIMSRWYSPILTSPYTPFSSRIFSPVFFFMCRYC